MLIYTILSAKIAFLKTGSATINTLKYFSL